MSPASYRAAPPRVGEPHLTGWGRIRQIAFPVPYGRRSAPTRSRIRATGAVRVHGGNLPLFEPAPAVEQQAAERAARAAEADVQRRKRELADAQVTLARRARYGQKVYETKREPRLVMKQRKRQAQVSAGKHRQVPGDGLAQARGRLDEALSAVRDGRDRDRPAAHRGTGRPDRTHPARSGTAARRPGGTRGAWP
jgi:hypothetical protein